MAQQGFYTDPPGRRLAYDADGTVGFTINSSNVVSVTTNSVLQELNNETDGIAFQVNQGSQITYGLIFPDFRDLTDIYHFYTNDGGGGGNNSADSIYISSNTTNGLDGTWTLASAMLNSSIAIPYFRIGFTGLIKPAIKAIRFGPFFAGSGGQVNIRNLHLYAVPSSSANPHRLIFCDSSGNNLARDMDYGDQPRNSTRVWSPTTSFNQPTALYLKNISTERTATTVQLGTDALTFLEMKDHVMISLDNITYGQTLNWASIAPGQMVGPIYVRHATTPTTTLGLQTMRLKTTIASWL